MLINICNFWNTFLGPVTKISNPTCAHMLTLLWAHTPYTHICSHCSSGWQTLIFCLGRAGCPISPLPPMADVGSPAPCVSLSLPTLCQQTRGMVRKSQWPQTSLGEEAHALPCAASPGFDIMPLGRLPYDGVAATLGFLPLHHYFSCLFCTSF